MSVVGVLDFVFEFVVVVDVFFVLLAPCAPWWKPLPSTGISTQ